MCITEKTPFRVCRGVPASRETPPRPRRKSSARQKTCPHASALPLFFSRRSRPPPATSHTSDKTRPKSRRDECHTIEQHPRRHTTGCVPCCVQNSLSLPPLMLLRWGNQRAPRPCASMPPMPLPQKGDSEGIDRQGQQVSESPRL